MDWNAIYHSRLEGLEESINYYDDLVKSGHRLSDAQRKDLSDISVKVSCFGEYGQFLYEYSQKLLAV